MGSVPVLWENYVMDPFVDLTWFDAHRGDDGVRLVDARSKPHINDPAAPSGAMQYAAGHIPGAVHIDYADHLKDPATPYALRVAPPERFADVVGSFGIGDETTVLAYDDGTTPYAARLLWMLRYYGHDAGYILAGGLPGYRAAGRAVTTEVPTYRPRRFTPLVRPELRASREDVLAVAEGRSDAQLVDAQRNNTYALRDRDVKGAVRLSGNELLEDAAGGRIAARDRLERLVAERNLDRHRRTILTCGSGVSAAGAYFALLEVGFTDLAVYDGSWMEWAHDALPTIQKRPA